MQIRNKKKPGSSYERFNSRDHMNSYFKVNRERAKQREKDIAEDYDYGENMDLACILSDPHPQPDGLDQEDQPDQHDV
jgi:hypothetical protein